MRRELPGETVWDEFHDDEIVDWKRCRSAIEHENTLVNHRLSWLFASQSFLFASFGVVWNAWKNPSGANSVPAQTSMVFLVIIAITGIVVCTAIQQSLLCAEKQIVHIDRWWYLKGAHESGERYKDDNERNMQRANRDQSHPPIQGDIHIEGNFFTRVLSFTFLPNWFNAVWLLLAFTVVIEKGPSFLVRSVTENPTMVLLLFIYSIAIMILFRKPSARSTKSLKALLLSTPRHIGSLLSDLRLLLWTRGWKSSGEPDIPSFYNYLVSCAYWFSRFGGLFLKLAVGLIVAAALIELTPHQGWRFVILMVYGIVLARITWKSKFVFSISKPNGSTQISQD
jgi:hypothetical protein